MTEWVEVPAGVVEIDESSVAVDAFAIGRFPVTCEEFARFVAEGGYQDQSLWTTDGWAWRERNGVRCPEFWDSSIQKQGHPVVGVFWHEAAAYCKWLSRTEGFSISLPSGAQRQRAAAGDDQLPYPWGRFFDWKCCNSAESGIGSTTPVDRYPNGRSPFGVYDMSGNVWEWCLDRWSSAIAEDHTAGCDEPPALRGGSYFDVALATLCEVRARYRSSSRLPYVGFRVVRTSERLIVNAR